MNFFSFFICVLIGTEETEHCVKAVIELPRSMYLNKKLFSPFKKHIMDGATSSVFRGKYNDTQVCIKQYKSHIKEYEILNEANILTSLPANEYFCFIVGVCLDVPKRLVTSFFGSDLPVKNTLEYHIKCEDISVDNSLLVIYKLLNAVKFLHNNDISHGDIKPNNTLVTFKASSVQLRMIDFGCASFISGFNHEIYKNLVENEEKKFMCRCNKHTAPEVHYGYPRSKYTDIYGIGYSSNKIISIHQEIFSSNKYKNLGVLLKTCDRVDPYSRPSISSIFDALEKCMI